MQDYRTASPSPVLVVAFGSRVLGLDPARGAVVWKHELTGTASEIFLVVTPTLVVAVGYVGIACFRYPTGEKLWSADSATSGRPTVLLDGDRLFVGRMGEVECWSLSGTRLWHEPFKGFGMGPVAIGVPDRVAQADHG